MDYNRAVVVGNLTRDPDLRTLPSGDSVCKIAIATNRTWKDKNGQKQQEVEYHNVVIFGKMADTVAQYMKKGSEMLAEGRLKTSSWEKDGVKRYSTEIVAENVRFGAKRDGNNQNGGYNQPAPQNTAQATNEPQGQQEPQYTPPPAGSGEVSIDEVPF